jgi:hypothetical protein
MERHADWDGFQSQILKLAWQGLSKGYKVVDLRSHLPEEFLGQPSSGSAATRILKVSQVNGKWLLLIRGANGRSAMVEQSLAHANR